MSSVAIVVAVVIVVFIVLKAASRPSHANHAGLRVEEGRFVREPTVLRVPFPATTADAAPTLLVVLLQVDVPLDGGVEQGPDHTLAA